MSLPDDFIGLLVTWTYEPRGFFRQSLLVRGDDYLLEADDGTATAKVYGDVAEDQSRELEDRMDMLIQHQFAASQLVDPRRFKLELRGVSRNRRDGTATVGAVFSGSFSVEQASEWGQLKQEEREARLARMQRLAEGMARHAGDGALASLIASFRAAIVDPGNALIHLYEVKEQLLDRFGKQLATQLQVDNDVVMQNIHRLSNDAVRQGRHRGKHAGSLRDATLQEMRAAQGSALDLIEGYIRYLASQLGSRR